MKKKMKNNISGYVSAVRRRCVTTKGHVCSDGTILGKIYVFTTSNGDVIEYSVARAENTISKIVYFTILDEYLNPTDNHNYIVSEDIFPGLVGFGQSHHRVLWSDLYHGLPEYDFKVKKVSLLKRLLTWLRLA